MRALLRCALPVLIVLCTGCATCGSSETDPTKVSTCQLLVSNKELTNYLKDRREYLGELNVRLTNLDDELLTSQAELFKVKQQLAVVEIPARELEALQRDILALEQEQESLSEEILLGKEEVSRLEAAINNSKEKDAALETELEEAKRKTERMEEKLAIVSAGVKRAAALNLKYSG